ncbi:MAG: hypothetical protein QHH75_13835 [Bacillota bacterium]|jgi:hypothetical protein|nr:hypothetical protein [Bacillota bacterium]
MSGETKTLSIRIRRDTFNELARIAEEKQITRSTLARILIVEAMKKKSNLNIT